MKTVAILDYGIGNVKSIGNALHEIGVQPVLTADHMEIMSADALILPGVGAFGKGMQNLTESGLIPEIHEFIGTGKPFLGICLGMQMMLEESDEFGTFKGLGLIKGKVRRLPVEVSAGERLPHVSWNEITPQKPGRWDNTMLAETEESSDVYFVHSYVAMPDSEEDILCQTTYGGNTFCSAVQKDNVTGVQFHPEKSGLIGLAMLKKFVNKQ